jgi:hypothetical protein
LKLINRIASLEALGQEKLALPNIAAIYRAIHTLDPNSVAVARYGLRIANQMYDPVLVGPRPTRPLERVEIDHTKLPLFVVDIESRMPIGTPWLKERYRQVFRNNSRLLRQFYSSQLFISNAMPTTRYQSQKLSSLPVPKCRK